jgi:hypothetical protein
MVAHGGGGTAATPDGELAPAVAAASMDRVRVRVLGVWFIGGGLDEGRGPAVGGAGGGEGAHAKEVVGRRLLREGGRRSGELARGGQSVGGTRTRRMTSHGLGRAYLNI